MNEPQETRKRTDSLDLDVEKVLYNDSPETLYLHGIIEGKIRVNEQNNDSTSPRRLFYNTDIIPGTSPKRTIPMLVPAETPKKQLNWRRASTPRKRRHSSSRQSSRNQLGKSRFFKICLLMVMLAATCWVSAKCDKETRVQITKITTGIMEATARRFNTLPSPTPVPEAAPLVGDTTAATKIELPPVCKNPVKKLFNKVCRLHARKLRLERKGRKAKRL